MVGLPLVHISWAVADNAMRKQCDVFFRDTFGAETAYEMLVTPETEGHGLDREESLMLIGDTMVIPIAAAGSGLSPDSPTGEMLRRSAAPGRWLGLALRVADLSAAAAWFSARGFKLHFDPGMETIYFLIGRKQALGVRLEIVAHNMPNDLRQKPGWNPHKWEDGHPLGIEGLQAIGVSAPSLDVARDTFGHRLDLPELGQRDLPDGQGRCLAFDLGDTVIEAMVPAGEDGDLAQHLRTVQGIYCLTFKVRSAPATAQWLRGRGLDLIGDLAGRFAIAPRQAHGRLIWFTQHDVPGYPALGSRLSQPAIFPA